VVAGGLASLARAKAGLQEWDEAERLFREALEIQRRTRPRPHIDTAEMLVGQGEVLSRRGRDAEAEPLLREALVQAQRSLPAGHWRRGEVESALGACLWRLGRREEARPLLVSGFELLRTRQGAAHPATVRAERRLNLMRGG
jgi:Flp pilus assembly protein TadD